jgi:hypothetical protein
MRDKIARELNIDPPILSSVLSESDSLGKLQVVVNYLERQQAFGTVDSPQTYVKGVMPLRWGMFSDEADRIGGKSLGMYDTVYFVGQTARTTVLLGGSSKHLLGMESGAATAAASMSSSNILRIAVMLAKELRERGELDGIADTPHAPSADLLERGAQTMMRELPEQQLEFLAKRLIYYPRPASEGRNVLLGTPLYVALAE